MDQRVKKRLHDALETCNRLQRIGLANSRSEFLADEIMQLAVWKLIEIVGEALHQAELIDPTLDERIVGLRDSVATRNRIVHGYESVDFDLMWDIVEDQIDPLLDQIEEELASR